VQVLFFPLRNMVCACVGTLYGQAVLSVNSNQNIVEDSFGS